MKTSELVNTAGLQALKLYAAQLIHEKELSSIGVSVHMDLAVDALVIRLERELLEDTHASKVWSVKSPLNAWEHIKHWLFNKRWCPAFPKNRYPVKYHTESVRFSAIYPDVDHRILNYKMVVLPQPGYGVTEDFE